MMSESTDELSAELDDSKKEGEPADNGSLRKSGFVLVSGSGTEVSHIRQTSPVVTTAASPPTSAVPIGVPPPQSVSREGSASPRNPYRGNLAQRHSHSHSPDDRSHDTAHFFTPSAPSSNDPLPSLSPPAPLPAVARAEPPGMPHLPQYQLPQFSRPEPEVPAVAPMSRDVGQEAFVGVGMGDEMGSGMPMPSGGGGGGGSGGGGFFSNFFSSDLMHRVVEKTKSGMESVITTLDPGMKEYIMGGGDLSLVIASVDNVESLAIRDAFYTVVGKSTIQCMAGHTTLAPQLIGADAARQACEQKIDGLRSSGQVGPDSAIVAVSNFLFQPTSNRWFVMEYLLLQDQQTECEAYSIPLPITADMVNALWAATPADFPVRWSGTMKTLDQLLQQQQATPLDPQAATEWRYSRFGLTRRDLIAQTARILARDYKQRFQGITALPGDISSVAFAS